MWTANRYLCFADHLSIYLDPRHGEDGDVTSSTTITKRTLIRLRSHLIIHGSWSLIAEQATAHLGSTVLIRVVSYLGVCHRATFN